MNVSCPECRSVFRVDPSKLPATAVRARCSVCGGVITISEGSSIEEEFASTSKSASSAAAPRPKPQLNAVPGTENSWNASAANVRGGTELLAARTSAPTIESVGIAGSGAGSSDSSATMRVGKESQIAATSSSPRQAGPDPALAAPMAQPAAPPVTTSPNAKPPQNRPVLFPPRPMMPTAGGAPGSAPTRPGAPASRPLTPPAASPQITAPRSLSQAPAPAMAPTAANANVAATAHPTRPPAAANPPAGTGTPARAPINPFLANDPHAKAKRLARALVSDLVTYFPQKCEEGLRDGTLKQLFKDEISKSYEEYVLHVGREFAETTPHFQDALNDILARGQKVF